jgi:hypothetical protein
MQRKHMLNQVRRFLDHRGWVEQPGGPVKQNGSMIVNYMSPNKTDVLKIEAVLDPQEDLIDTFTNR